MMMKSLAKPIHARTMITSASKKPPLKCCFDAPSPSATLVAFLVALLSTLSLTTSAATIYTLDVVLPPMNVGQSLESYESRIVINRPSPGDNFWYRLPHRVDVVGGQLPPGITLVQKGAGFHELANFSGVPTQAGTFTVDLVATMADGAKTTATSVTFSIEDPKKDVFTIQHWGTELLLQGEQPLNAGFQLVNSAYQTLRAPLDVNAVGLPDGLTLAARGFGYYMLVGEPRSVGNYEAEIQFQWPNGGETVASKKLQIQVVAESSVPTDLSLSIHSISPVRQGTAYEGGNYTAPWITVYDSIGRQLNGPFQIEASGLPEGMSFSPEGFLVGKPLAAGTFEVTLEVTLANGLKTNPQTFTLKVDAALSIADLAGTYDCVIERSESLNAQLGGRLRFVMSPTGQVSGFVIHKNKRVSFTTSNATFDPEESVLTITPPGLDVVIRGTFSVENDYSTSEDSPFIVFSGTADRDDDSVALRGSRATPRTAQNPSPYAGPLPINVLFVQKDDSALLETFGGAGFMAVSITPQGNATVTVWSADGSQPTSFATTLSETSIGAFLPVFVAPKNSSGSSTLMGQLFVNSESNAAGEMSWYQPPSKKGTFPEGIALVSYEGVIGSRHVIEPSGLNRLGLEQSIIDAELDLIGEGVLSESEVNITLSGALMKAAPATGQVSDVKMTYSPRTGVVTGSLTLGQPRSKSARMVTFRGMRAPDGESIMGHYTVADPSNRKRSRAGMMTIGATGE